MPIDTATGKAPGAEHGPRHRVRGADTVTNGPDEMEGAYCDGANDCAQTYHRWNGTVYEAYRRARDELLLE